ncbi:uncharacterized protein PAC_01960 [Phialocephala subalpina]|uniref:Uncharacterized protein n=1 Tax=Phialocephala subalpina TaxID=576137 RepID=A0A1L7WH49_9HELO|nr:uncharacterized protein PAC_01960 [Phialocephala subalpina]
MPGIQKFEPGQHVKRPWSQSIARRDVEFRSLEGGPVGRVRKYSEKEMDQAHLNVSRKVVAVQRAEADGAQKRARTAWRPEEARKKYRGDYAQDNDLKDSVNSSAGACIIVGQREISAMELRKYLDTEPNPSHTDQPSMKSSPTVPKQDYNPTPSYPKAPPNSPQIENSHPQPCGNMKGSLSNQEATFKVPEVLSTLEEPGEGREECRNGVTTSTEEVSANTTQPLPPQSSIVTHQELPVDTCPPPAQPQTDNISGAASSALRRLPITDLLNDTSRAEDVKPPQPTTMKITSSAQPVTDTGLGKLQGEVPPGCQPHIKRSSTSRRTLSKIASHPETSSRGQASGASEMTLVRASDRKSASGPRSDRMPLEGSAVAQKLAVVGKILIPKSAPDSIVMLSIDPLLSQNAPDFFRFYSQTAGAGEAPVLCFGLPDVAWQRHQIQNISRGDFDAFHALKRTIWYCFCTFLTRGPGSAIFRVTVTAPARQEADDTVTISRPTAGRNECSRASTPLARPMCHNPAASHAELVHSLPSASQASLSNTKTSSCQRVVPIGFQPTLRSRDAGPPTQREHSTTGFPAVPTRNSTRKTLRDRLPSLQIAPAPQHHHPLVLPPAVAYRQDKPVSETSSVRQIVVRIQENEHCRFSRPYSKHVLLSEVTTVDFFAWFARCTGYDNPSGPPELKFTWKDALPKPEYTRIKRGDEKHFQFMKAEIEPLLERAKALMPELIEFTILVTVPRWAVERPGDEL